MSSRDGGERTRWRFLSWLESPGLRRGQERGLKVALVLVALLLCAGWTWVIADAARTGQGLPTRQLTTSPLDPEAGPPAAFLLDRLARAVVEETGWQGHSGAVRTLILEEGESLPLADTLGLDSLPEGARVEVAPVDTAGAPAPPQAAAEPGAWSVLLRVGDEARRLRGVSVLSPVSTRLIEGGRLGAYLIGEWPSTAGRGGQFETPAYDAPRGVIRVTPETVDLPVSEHLTLGDFLTKGQADVWPKYLVLSPRILDKVELTVQVLEERGHPVENLGIISGFRTPNYNAHGGSTAGRGNLSRHMYGDALDFYVDNDGDGQMDDLDGDGGPSRGDGAIIADAAAEVERRYPEYVGGVGIYPPNPGAHAGFVHIDTRGYRARW